MSPWVPALHESDTGAAPPICETHGQHRIDISMPNKRARGSVGGAVGQQGVGGESG